MGELVSMADARQARRLRKQADLFNLMPFLAMQAAYLEMIRASFYASMAICFGERRH